VNDVLSSEAAERMHGTLDALWRDAPGFAAWLRSVDHKSIGKRYVITAFAFFLLGGMNAAVMRLQLARPQNTLVGPERYDQLFSMQSKFLTTNLKGTDREMYLPINLDFDQDPFIRPGGAPTSILNHPPNARLEKRSIPPGGSRVADYKVPGDLLKKPGKYRLAARLRGRTEPIYFMEFVFATEDMKKAENEWVTDTHQYAVAFEVH